MTFMPDRPALHPSPEPRPPPTPHSGPRATASAPIRCQSHSWASAPSRSCRRWPASPSRRTESTGGRSPDEPCRRDVPDPGPGIEPGAERVRARGRMESIEHPATPSAAMRSWARGSGMLLDHPVSADHDGRWDRDAEGLRRPQIDDQLHLGRLFDRNVTGLGTLQDLVYLGGATPEHVEYISAIPRAARQFRRNEATPRWRAADI